MEGRSDLCTPYEPQVGCQGFEVLHAARERRLWRRIDVSKSGRQCGGGRETAQGFDGISSRGNDTGMWMRGDGLILSDMMYA
jgi:hypothetical protein